MLQTISHANITRCHFKLNHASGEGGAIYIATKSELRVFVSDFTMNRAKSGGSVAVYMGDSLIKSCSFISDNASEYGGCIHLKTANMTVKQSILSGCRSGYHGGSMCVFHHSTLRLETVVINNSYSTVYGGSIYVKSKVELFVIDSVLTNSSSGYFAGIGCYYTSRVYLDSALISYCHSNSQYACVDIFRCTLTMNNITITNTDHAIKGCYSTIKIFNTLSLNDTVKFLYAESSDLTLWNLNISGTRIKLYESVAEFRHTIFVIQNEICPIQDTSGSNITFKSVYLPHTANMSQSESRIVCKQPETVVNGNTSGKKKVFEFI